MDLGQFDDKDVHELHVSVDVSPDIAVLVSQAVVTATVYGAHAPWRRHFTMNVARHTDTWKRPAPLSPPSDVGGTNHAGNDRTSHNLDQIRSLKT